MRYVTILLEKMPPFYMQRIMTPLCVWTYLFYLVCTYIPRLSMSRIEFPPNWPEQVSFPEGTLRLYMGIHRTRMYQNTHTWYSALFRLLYKFDVEASPPIWISSTFEGRPKRMRAYSYTYACTGTCIHLLEALFANSSRAPTYTYAPFRLCITANACLEWPPSELKVPI